MLISYAHFFRCCRNYIIWTQAATKKCKITFSWTSDWEKPKLEKVAISVGDVKSPIGLSFQSLSCDHNTYVHVTLVSEDVLYHANCIAEHTSLHNTIK